MLKSALTNCLAIKFSSFRSNTLATEAIRSSLNCPNSEEGLSYSRHVLPGHPRKPAPAAGRRDLLPDCAGSSRSR